ncbi:MAG: hypothetical protein R3E18_09965 [Sphingomonadaceae bacterium]
MRYGLALMLVLPLVSLYFLGVAEVGAYNGQLVVQAIAIGLASAWLTQFALLRGLLLTFTDGPAFSALSVMQWFILGAVTVVLLGHTTFVFEIGYAVSGALSMAVIIVYLRRFLSTAEHTGGNSINWRTLRVQSTHVLLQAGLFGVQPFLTNSMLARWGNGLQEVGLFNVASMVVTLPNVLVLPRCAGFCSTAGANRSIGPDFAGRPQWVNSLVPRARLALLASPLVSSVVARWFLVRNLVALRMPHKYYCSAIFAIVAGQILTPALPRHRAHLYCHMVMLCQMFAGTIAANSRISGCRHSAAFSDSYRLVRWRIRGAECDASSRQTRSTQAEKSARLTLEGTLPHEFWTILGWSFPP